MTQRGGVSADEIKAFMCGLIEASRSPPPALWTHRCDAFTGAKAPAHMERPRSPKIPLVCRLRQTTPPFILKLMADKSLTGWGFFVVTAAEPNSASAAAPDGEAGEKQRLRPTCSRLRAFNQPTRLRRRFFRVSFLVL